MRHVHDKLMYYTIFIGIRLKCPDRQRMKLVLLLIGVILNPSPHKSTLIEYALFPHPPSSKQNCSLPLSFPLSNMSEPYRPFHFSSLSDAVNTFRNDPLSPLSFPKMRKLQPVSEQSSIAIRLQETNTDYVFHIIAQILDNEKYGHNMNLNDDEKV